VPQLSEVLGPGYLEGLERWPIERVRACRDEATEAETGLSYLRRMVQGRLDIVLSEHRRRELGEEGGDLDDLVTRLPDILGDRVRGPGLGRLPALMGPGELPPDLTDRLEAVLPASWPAALQEFDLARLEAAWTALDELERSLSSQRRSVFEVLERLQEELVRRYRSGEASVDSLLP
jgi:RsiG-like